MIISRLGMNCLNMICRCDVYQYLLSSRLINLEEKMESGKSFSSMAKVVKLLAFLSPRISQVRSITFTVTGFLIG